jgi:DNA repair exonuclease SbcCD ATPase subunit
LPPQSRHRLSSTREQPVRRLSNAARAERARSNSASIPTPPQQQQPPTTPQTLESLTQELDRVNRETAELTAQLESEEDRNRSEISKLESELEDLRAQKKEDDDSKAGIKAETKSLEEQKRAVDATKSKLDRTLRSLQEELAKLEAEASSQLSDLAEREQALADLCDQTAIAGRRVLEAKTRGREGLMEVQRQISALEEGNRTLAQKIAFMKSSAESKDTEEEKTRIKNIDEREDEEDLKVEREWIESEKTLKARRDELKSQLDEVRTPKVKAYFRQIGSSAKLLLRWYKRGSCLQQLVPCLLPEGIGRGSNGIAKHARKH